MCMDAYAEGDAGLAAALDDMDDRLDDLHADYIQAVLDWGATWATSNQRSSSR